ncbi:hypothetical protein EMPS_05220 [Entomortierella parvispora]|uniref:Uncharacterized protein n=1 Tax=Entomortierella parvispora TaxID=205924 RepID=A0A9P3LW98_9FUNG|nr:hypothetical protein EMPS_05220 [Entomortierella parvispora]
MVAEAERCTPQLPQTQLGSQESSLLFKTIVCQETLCKTRLPSIHPSKVLEEQSMRLPSNQHPYRESQGPTSIQRNVPDVFA